MCDDGEEGDVAVMNASVLCDGIEDMDRVIEVDVRDSRWEKAEMGAFREARLTVRANILSVVD